MNKKKKKNIAPPLPERPSNIFPDANAPPIIIVEDSPIVVDSFEISLDDNPIAYHKEEGHALSILFTILFHITPFLCHIMHFCLSFPLSIILTWSVKLSHPK